MTPPPKPSITPPPCHPDLPVTDALPALHAALNAGRNAVLVAPPGAGKTTLVPLALLDAPWRGDGRILMLEPRRLATRAAATRMAFLLGEPVGQTVGYRTRLDGAGLRRNPRRGHHRGPAAPPPAIRSRPGRRRRRDPGRNPRTLAGIRPRPGAVPRPAAHAAAGPAPAGHVRHRRRRPLSGADGRRGHRKRRPDVPGRPSSTPSATSPIPATCRTPSPAPSAPRWPSTTGDILAFLPGMAEIRRAQAALDGCGALVLPLHGELPPAEQDRALRPAETAPRGAGDLDRGDLADRARRAHRGRWRLAARRRGSIPRPA